MQKTLTMGQRRGLVRHALRLFYPRGRWEYQAQSDSGTSRLRSAVSDEWFGDHVDWANALKQLGTAGTSAHVMVYEREFGGRGDLHDTIVLAAGESTVRAVQHAARPNGFILRLEATPEAAHGTYEWVAQAD